jgi:hypothetical protein
VTLTPTRRQVLAGVLAVSAAAATRRVSAADAPRSPHPSELTLVELVPLLAARELSARELVEYCLRVTDALEPTLMA